MLSRRNFLHTSAVTAAAGLVGTAVADGTSGKSAVLPPSIEALRSRRDEAKPITIAERAGRQEKARRLMQENKLDAILMMEGTSLTYFTGMRWWGGERMFAMILPAKG